ncbi:hypothetical protein [Polaromonas sp. SM01]|uniref:hypothetical protein n=1 Tax=Polaromonas sp. SM01 TaxID=3085630 RepID=UPI00298107FC|nr:hypothetical protein [Polaromonas sp. SM01]MDW5441182.1 hypothetical protein [Polaromonas sp. SM01]
MPDVSPGLRTPSFRYTLRQIASRDEIVFKSVVRVLQGKTRHVWQHTDGADADLFVLGTQVTGEPTRIEDLAGHVLIRVSASAGTDFRGLSLPLRIADVISHLDQAGDEIASRAARPAGPQAVDAPAPVQVLFNQRVSLTRWPEPALLQRDNRYLKLATALTGQPVSLTELADRTQFPLVLCQTFVDALRAVGLLRVMDEVRDAPGHIHTAAPTAQRNPPVEYLGLIARIRSRLEMLVRTPTAK